MKIRSCKFNKVFISLSLVITFIFIFAICFINTNVAYAQLPETYMDANQDKHGVGVDYDWYFSEHYLGLDRAKFLLSDMHDDINWEYLEDHPVIVAVVDSGIDVDHPLFTGAYDQNGAAKVLGPDEISPYDVLLRDENGEIIGKNVAPDRNGDEVSDLSDTAYDSHGTHVSGILAVLIHYLELEKYIKIMPVKASYVGSGNKNYYNADDIFSPTDGALHFATYNGADVINMSFASDGTQFNSSSLPTYAASSVLVAAASNNGDKKNYYPAASSYVIGVMNSKPGANNTPTLSTNSARGNQYEIAAPGYEIISSVTDLFDKAAQYKFDEDGIHYGELSGTSMSAPMVSFAAALLTMKYRGIFADEEKEPTTNAIKAFTTYSTYSNMVDDIKVSYLQIDKLLETDFLDDSSGEYVIPPDAITISSKDLKQTLDIRHEITLEASIQPVEYQYAPNLKWYTYDPEDSNRQGDTLIGTGKSITYMPDNRQGYTHIYSVLTYNNGANHVQSNELTFTMEYYYLTPTKVKILADDELPTGNVDIETGEELHLSIKDFQYVDPDHAPKIMWYVNNEFVNEGATLNYKPQQVGTYNVYVTVNSAKSDFSVTLNVTKSTRDGDFKMPLWQIWLISTAITVALASIVVMTIILVKKSKK